MLQVRREAAKVMRRLGVLGGIGTITLVVLLGQYGPGKPGVPRLGEPFATFDTVVVTPKIGTRATVAQVPQGKRLSVRYLSAKCQGTPPAHVEVGSRRTRHFVPMSGRTVAGAPIWLDAGPGQSLEVMLASGPNAIFSACQISISGFYTPSGS